MASSYLVLRPDACAPSPAHPALLRERPGTGIGQRGRMEGDPATRAQDLTSAQLEALPATLGLPRPGFPLVVGLSDAGQEACSPATEGKEGGQDGGETGGEALLGTLGREARRIIDESLRSSAGGALLFTKLPIRQASDFSAFLKGTALPPVLSHGASERASKASGVFGASDDVPETHTLHPHNEQAYLASEEDPSYPRKILFCCLEPSMEGGETPIASNRRISELMGEDVMERFRDGVLYVQTLSR